jgi:hypothetical protein
MTRFVKENSQIPKRSDDDRFVQRSSNKFQTLNPKPFPKVLDKKQNKRP